MVDISPTTKIIQFLVRDKVGALANAIQIFSVSLFFKGAHNVTK